MQHPSRPRILLALAVAGTVMSLGLTSCMTLSQPNATNAAQPTSGSESPAPPLIPLVWADGTRVTAHVQGVESARAATKNQDFTEESSTRGFTDAKTAFLVEAVESSGTLVGTYGPRQSDEKLGKTGHVIDPGSRLIGRHVDGTFEPFTVAGTSKNHIPQEIAGMAVTDSGLIWGELQTEHAATRGWKILGVSPGSTEVRVLATRSWKKSPNDDVDYTSLSSPVLVDGRVYWNVQRFNPADDFSEDKMFSVDLEKPGTVLDEFARARTDENPPTDALYTGEDVVLGAVKVPDDSKKGYTETVSSYAPGGKREEILHVAEKPAAEWDMDLMGADEGGFAVNHDENLYLIDPRTRETEMFQRPEGAEISWLTQCGPLVSWTYQGESEDLAAKRFVYNRDSKDLAVVSGSRGQGLEYCSGDYMSWSTGDPKDRTADSGDVVVRWKN